MEGLVFLMVVAIIAAVAISATRRRARRRTALEILAAHLRGTSNGDHATGTLDGIATTVQFTTRGAGSSSESWTYVTCTLPPGYPLALHVRRHGRNDHAQIARGELVDVRCGDPRFDEAFLVEGAPAAIVRAMLDAPARAFLRATPEVELDTLDDGTLRLAVRGWLEQLDHARPALEHVAGLAGALRRVSAGADREVPLAVTDDPYRPMADDDPLRAARAARAAEVEALRTQRAARPGPASGLAIFLVVLFLLSVMLRILQGVTGDRRAPRRRRAPLGVSRGGGAGR